MNLYISEFDLRWICEYFLNVVIKAEHFLYLKYNEIYCNADKSIKH